MKMILASASPRRRELLGQIGADFLVMPSKGEETVTKSEPAEVVLELATQKAGQGRSLFLQKYTMPQEQTLVIGADTLVAIDHQILGKPKDREDARRMITLLAGKTHQVYTGVCVWIYENKEWRSRSFYEKTDVTMYPMDESEIEAYLNTPEPYDKAGAYGIQGKCAVYIKMINGDYNNVVGLPIARLYQELKKEGISIERS